ncbi:MAG: hypothetical protein ACTSQ7_05350 [Alphaproteobacteria bacterium]
MWQRFPIPEFDRDPFKNMDWQAPTFLTESEIAEKIAAGAHGAYPVMPGDDFFARLDVRGVRRHALLCVMPATEVRILGRSYAWPIQRAWILDSLEPGKLHVLADWKTPRPMNNRLGPEDGMVHGGGAVYLMTATGHSDHWIGNRTIADNGRDGGAAGHGFRVLSSASEDSRDFHDCNVSFAWSG